jgi:hypothetical protein
VSELWQPAAVMADRRDEVRGRSIAERRRLRRRLLIAGVALVFVAVALPFVVGWFGFAVPAWAVAVALGGVAVVSAFFARDGYLDARTRGLSRSRAALVSVGAFVFGWWSTGV